MTEFATSLDIANRALQIAGANRITSLDVTVSDTREAAECAAAYDKIRQAELRTNCWKFAVRKAALRPIDTDTLILTPKAYSAATYYQFNAIVSYGGLWWQNVTSMNYANTPGTTADWVPYFGPVTVTPFDTTETTEYYQGELVYTDDFDLANADYYFTYSATVAGVTATPTTAPTYDAAVTYAQGDTVTYSAAKWISMIANNLGHTPTATYNRWASGTTYASTDYVVDPATGRIYDSQQNANTGHRPDTDDGTWWIRKTTNPIFQAWVQITSEPNAALGWSQQPPGFTLVPPKLIYPVGTGPVSQVATRNIYMLPNGYVRKADQNPSPGAIGALGGPLNNLAQDWELENNIFVSGEVDPIVFRFVADIVDVSKMDALFCEGVAAKLAIAVIPILTQSDAKLRTAAQIYRDVIAQARTINGIEMGSSQPPQDDYITVRY